MAKKRALALSAPAALAREADPTGERSKLLALCGEPETLPRWWEVRKVMNNTSLCKDPACLHVPLLNVPWLSLIGLQAIIVGLLAGFSLSNFSILVLFIFPETYLLRLLNWRLHRRQLEAKRMELLAQAPDKALQLLGLRWRLLKEDLLEDNRSQVGHHSTLARVCDWFETQLDILIDEADGFRVGAKKMGGESSEMHSQLLAAEAQVEVLLTRLSESLERFNGFSRLIKRLHAHIQQAINHFTIMLNEQRGLAERFTKLEALQGGGWDQASAEILGAVEPMLADLPPFFEALARLERCGKRLRSGVDKLREMDASQTLLTQLQAFDEVIEEAEEMLDPEQT
ncbi:MAG: hypothetical protein Q7N87_05090 [Candidatus Uhrbacteria bacterium]|nr:hypothetical protein [Candidatus Uhrbacteria bacterium]